MKKLNIFDKFFSFLKTWYDKLFTEYDKEGTAAVLTVNIIKEVIESPVTEWVVKLTPTEYDDIALRWAKQYALNAINTWALARNLLTEGATNEEIIEVIAGYFKSITKNAKKSFYVDLAADLAVYLADGKITWTEALMLTQKIFRERFQLPELRMAA
jgi:hypothetical protein